MCYVCVLLCRHVHMSRYLTKPKEGLSYPGQELMVVGCSVPNFGFARAVSALKLESISPRQNDIFSLNPVRA